jgi:serine/threonine protein kinase/tetratricopeptide (TPR) repeat protein
MSTEPLGPGTDPYSAADNPADPDDCLTEDELPPRPISEGPGMSIDRYRLIRKIGEGGMGAVYLAEQAKPVRRNVALKIIKPGMDSHQVIARFESERQALALMDHPNIAKVLDAGTTNTGRPFFAMELVTGIPVTDYCDSNQLTTRERLELFIPVCQAIQHAHQKGIIHRDVKPSNLLVTLVDSLPAPKVIDFGVAKAIDQRLTEKTVFTHFGQLVGTLEYMSPEQAEIGVMDVDTRSDIYSLGVVLYELLTGSTPFRRAKQHEAAYTEVLRQIREDEPPKPSTRLSESRDTLQSISARRQTEPARLTKLVRGELDWIVMKALDKDRTRRYETANGLARDIQRYLDGDPVEAGPPSASYKLRKMVRKHRTALSTAGAFVALLVLASAISTYLAIQATRAERAARKERDRAVDAEGRAQVNLAKAQTEERKAKQSESETSAVLQFFQAKVLAAARPKDQEGGLGIGATIREAVDAAEPEIEKSFADKPMVEAMIRDTLGSSYYYLGERTLAIRQYERQVAVLRQVGQLDDPHMLAAMNNLALAYWSSNRSADAVPLFEEAIELQKTTLGPDHPDTLTSMSNLGMAYRAAGRTALSMAIGEETLKLRKVKLGPEDHLTLLSMCNVASVYQDVGRLTEALALFDEALRLMKAKLGPEHPDTLAIANNLAVAFSQAGRLDRAVPLLEETLKACESKLGPDHPSTLKTLASLGRNYADANRLGEGIARLEEALERARSRFGQVPADLARLPSQLTDAYTRAGQFAKAEPIARESLELARKQFGPADPRTAGTMATLGLILFKQQKWAEAEPVLRDCLKIREAKQPEEWSTFNTRSLLGGSLVGQKKLSEAEPLIVGGFEGLKAREANIPGPAKQYLPEAGARIVSLYEMWGKKDKADEWRKSLALATDSIKPKP